MNNNEIANLKADIFDLQVKMTTIREEIKAKLGLLNKIEMVNERLPKTILPPNGGERPTTPDKT